jgi:hypothetical protein
MHESADQSQDRQKQQMASLFDHLVGTLQERFRNGKAECKQTRAAALHMSAFGGKADMPFCTQSGHPAHRLLRPNLRAFGSKAK